MKYISVGHQNDILSESVFLKKANCPYIVKCYHTFLSEKGDHVIMALELCNNTLKSEIRHLKWDMKQILRYFI